MDTRTEKRITGDIGEEIAVRFLVKHGYTIAVRNYWKPFGEIDIVAQKGSQIHFVEVKTVSRRTFDWDEQNSYRPEEQVHQKKLERIGRTIEVYLSEFHVEQEWKFHVITVLLDRESKKARVRMLYDLVL